MNRVAQVVLRRDDIAYLGAHRRFKETICAAAFHLCAIEAVSRGSEEFGDPSRRWGRSRCVLLGRKNLMPALAKCPKGFRMSSAIRPANRIGKGGHDDADSSPLTYHHIALVR